MASKLEHALKLAERGFYVFPLAVNSKVPPKDMRYKERATRDAEQIRAWWQEADYNIGIYTGQFQDPGTPLVAIDLDVKEGVNGQKELERLAATHKGEIPRTLTTKTPSGGRHLFFFPGRPVGTKVQPFAPAIDTRGAGGYVVGMGSTIDGKGYAFMDVEAAIAPCPTWLHELLPEPGKAKSEAVEPAMLVGVDTDRATARAIQYLETDAPKGEAGSRNATCYKVAARLRDMGVTHDTTACLIAEHWTCTPPLAPDEIEHVVNSAYRYGTERPGSAAPEAEFQAVPADMPLTTTGLNLVVTCVADVQAKPINWLWPDTFAHGKTSMIAGIPGLGKSQLTISLAAAVSTGGTLPSGHSCARGDVVLVTAEDAIDDTIRPRLEAAGADLRRVRVIESVRTERNGQEGVRGFNIQSDMQQLRLLARDLPELRLVVIDPVSAFLGATDSHNNSEVRALLSPLGKFAEDAGVAVLMVSHLNKGSGPANARVTGSGAFTAAPRAAYLVGTHPEDEEKLIMTPIKNNIGDSRTAWVFEVESITLPSGIKSSRVKWLGRTDTITADEALEKKPERNGSGARREAEAFLVGALQEGPKPISEVMELARQRDIKEITLRRAFKAVGGMSQKAAGSKNGSYLWSLPPRDMSELPLSAAEIFSD